MSTSTGRTRTKQAALAGLALVTIPAVAACGLISSPSATPGLAQPTPGYRPTIPAPTEEIGFCLDPTLSTAPAFAHDTQQLVAGIVAGWAARAQAVQSTAASAPQPGLDLWMRQVTTNSYDTSNTDLHVQIGAVPGLTARLAATSPDFLADDPAWVAARTTVRTDAAAALRSAIWAAGEIRSWPLATLGNSDIAGCESALAQTVPTPNRIIVASDLEQNEPPQIAGDLHHTQVLVIQPCNGTASACTGLAARFRTLLARRGARSITGIRPEQAASVLPGFMRG